MWSAIIGSSAPKAPHVIFHTTLSSCYEAVVIIYSSNLDGGEALLCSVFDRPSAALRQVASPVLSLWLDEDLQLFPVSLVGELT